MSKSLAIHGALVIVALVAAFAAWRHDREVADSVEEGAADIVIAELAASDIKGVIYTSKNRFVELTLSKEGPHWVEVTTKMRVRPPRIPRPEPAKATSPDGGAGDAGAPDGGASSNDADVGRADGGDAEVASEPEYREKRQRFAGNDNVDKLLERLTPLKVVRKLGKLSAAQLDEFELVEPEVTLKIVLTEGERVFEVGAQTYGRGSHYYVLDTSSGEAHLMSSNIVRELELAGSKLMLRDLHRFEIEDVGSAIIAAGDRRATTKHVNRHDARGRSWALEGGPEDGTKALTTWMKQVERLRALSYPEPGEEFLADGGINIFRVEYESPEGEELGFVEIAKSKSAPAEFFGRSEATGTWVELSRSIAETLESDLESVFPE